MSPSNAFLLAGRTYLSREKDGIFFRKCQGKLKILFTNPSSYNLSILMHQSVLKKDQWPLDHRSTRLALILSSLFVDYILLLIPVITKLTFPGKYKYVKNFALRCTAR